MRRWTPVLLVLALTALAAPAVAQPVEGPFVDEAFEAVVRFLDLDTPQVDTFVTLLEQRDLSATPIREDLEAVEEAIRAEIESDEPDSTALGELVLERHALREDLAGVHRTFVDGFVAMLTDDQADRLGLVRAARRVRPVIPAFERFGLLILPTPPEEEPLF